MTNKTSTITDLFRPFASLLAGRAVLSVGPETTVIGDFLEKTGADVTTMDCSDLHEGDRVKKFDFAVWICGRGPARVTDACRKIAALLKEEGSLLMAAGNPLGLTVSRAASGSRDMGCGKRELGLLLTEAGLTNIDYYYPFPDMEVPAVLLDKRAFEIPSFDVGNLIEPTYEHNAAGAGERRQVQLLISNGLMTEHSNSIFLVASRQGTRLLPKEILGFCFNGNRYAPYNKMNVFYQTADNTIMVRRIPYDRDIQPEAGLPVIQELVEERYLPGRLYSLALDDIVGQQGWSLADLRSWAQPYLAHLKSYADDKGWMDGRYLDLAPFNILTHKGSFTAVDLEWKAEQPIPVEYVFFRGLYHSLLRAAAMAEPAEGTPTNLFGLVLAVSETLLDETAGLLETFLQLEPFYFGGVFPEKDSIPADREMGALAEGGLSVLEDCRLQVFAESDHSGFSEERSTTLLIGLAKERRVYSMLLPWHNVRRLRIDPGDQPGLLAIHSVDLRTVDGRDLYHWTPYSRSRVDLSGVVIMHPVGSMSEAATILLNGDPMMIFPVGADTVEDTCVVLEVEVSALSPPAAAVVMENLKGLSSLISNQ